MSLMVDISGHDDHECHVQCRWQRVTEYVYCLSSADIKDANLHYVNNSRLKDNFQFKMLYNQVGQ